ncbi:hypothetical protein ACFOWE_18160 [Planomonospora corallina]|uniref:Lipoprotein n=1 Tax=Planomonospora corallina TaxID=1806052 RepID=A0ABV8I7P4_9ACTN
MKKLGSALSTSLLIALAAGCASGTTTAAPTSSPAPATSTSSTPSVTPSPTQTPCSEISTLASENLTQAELSGNDREWTQASSHLNTLITFMEERPECFTSTQLANLGELKSMTEKFDALIQAQQAETENESTGFQAQRHSGKGDKVLRLKGVDQPVIVKFTHDGSSNFAINSLDENGDETDLLVNTIGDYQGTVLAGMREGSSPAAFKIQADGPWTVEIKDVLEARTWPESRITGKGDDVLIIPGTVEGFTVMTAEHSGESNFVIHAYTQDREELLVNEIGKYTGEVTLPNGTAMVRIEADGKWTLVRD